MNMENISTFLTTTGVDIAIKVIAAIIFWVVGRWIINKVLWFVQSIMSRNKVDPMLSRYLGSIIGVLLNIVLVIGILGYFGVETTSFAALLAGAGLAIGTAWGGLLSNFAAGAFLLVLRPIKVGDWVTVGGVTGEVKELGVFATTVVTVENVITIIGNNKIFSGDIFNFSALPVRRVELKAQISGEVDPQVAIEKLSAAVKLIPNVAETPTPIVKILEFNFAGCVIAVFPYTHTNNYWQVYFDTNEMIAKVGRAEKWPAPAPLQSYKKIE